MKYISLVRVHVSRLSKFFVWNMTYVFHTIIQLPNRNTSVFTCQLQIFGTKYDALEKKNLMKQQSTVKTEKVKLLLSSSGLQQ